MGDLVGRLVVDVRIGRAFKGEMKWTLCMEILDENMLGEGMMVCKLAFVTRDECIFTIWRMGEERRMGIDR